MRRSFEGKRHQPAKSEEKRKRCDRKHRGFGFFCAFLLCAGLISGGAAVSGESGAQEAVNAEAPADDAVQPEVPAQPVEEAQQNTPAPEDTEGGGEAGQQQEETPDQQQEETPDQQQEETPDQQQEELYPEDDGNGEESVPSVSRPDAGSAESSAAPVGTTAEPLTVSVTTAMKYAFAGENALTFETQITGGTEPFETSYEIDRDGTPVWSAREYQPELTYMPEEAGGYELVLSVTDAAGQAASGRCAIPVAVRHEESPSDWEPALKEVRMTGRYAEDLLAIARTQLGYTESADNFIVTEEGARQGYTRYGQWQGDAYEPWDAAFAAFCLYYAGVRDVPADTKAEKWADELKRRGMYRDLTAENRPEEGDFLFTRDGEVTRIGLVEKTDDTGVTAIEGDVGGAVARVTYGWDDARLAGFGDPRTTLTDEAAGVTVTGIFPEGATLTVQLLAEDADGFTEAQDRIHAALSPLYDRYAVNLADVTETAVYVPSLTVNGEVVSPCKKVRVGVSACGGRFAGHGDVRVLTFSDEQTELLSAEEKDGGDGADAIVSASFRTDRLSEFALTAVAPDRLTMRRTAADGDAKVTVTYGTGAGVPESAELRVRQIRGDGDDADRAEYQKRQAEAAALLETEAGGENAASQPDTAASGSPGNAENADVSRQTDQNAENAAADQQADQNAENAAADQTEDSKEYAAYMEEVEAALASGRKVQMAKLFDITILDKEGNEVEPLTPVCANIEFVPKEVQEGTDLELYQFQTEGEKPQVMENVEVLTDDDNIVNGIEFETDGFSVYGIIGTSIEKTVLASDGHNYRITVTYGTETGIPADADLAVEEITEKSSAYDAYVADTENLLGMAKGCVGYIRLFDIKIVDRDNAVMKYQPADGTTVEVKIELADKNAGEEAAVNTQVVHFTDGSENGSVVNVIEVDGNTISFKAEGFSAYAIVEGPIPEAMGWEKITTLEEFHQHAETGMIIGHPNGFYFKDTTYNVPNQSGRKGIAKTKPASKNYPPEDAVYYYFEFVEGHDDQFYAYCIKDGVRQYIKRTSNSLAFTTSNTDGTIFTLSKDTDGTWDVKSDNYYWNMQGDDNGNGFAAYNQNNNGSKIDFWFYDAPESDPYQLDNQSYGIMNWSGGISGRAMMSSSGTENALDVKSLTVMTKKENDADKLFVPDDSEISKWTFHWIEKDQYYLTTVVDGSTYYLKIDSNGLHLIESEQEASQIQVLPGTGSHTGEICLKSGSDILTYSGNAATGFGVNGATGNEWLYLVRDSELTTDYFVTQSAQKVSVSKVPNGERIIVYSRVWNDTTKEYELYAVNSDGTLVRVYESGDSIQWVGTQLNTLLWDFTEYYWENTTEPNYYYELYNEYSESYIAPQLTGGQILQDSPIGIHLNGRRNGQYYSSILTWDEDNYAYTGLKVENGKIVSCPKSEAMDFYFAVMEDVPVDDTLHTVPTVDNTKYGIKMRMVNFETNADQNLLLSGNTNGTGTMLGASSKAVKNLLSTNLDEDGYPIATKTNQSMQSLYNQAVDVNKLFIQSTYNATGYFEYDSSQNFASWDQSTQDFIVYKELGSYDSGGNKPTLKHGQFFPYNDLEPGVFASVNGKNLYSATAELLPDSDPRKNEQLYLIKDPDAYFGMELEASFTQTLNGKDDWGHDIIYEFTGDDDFWLYVDGELVIDLGGTHSALPGFVNFSTGVVTQRNANGKDETTTLYEIFKKNYITRGATADEAEAKAQTLFKLDDAGNWVFPEYTSHTMKIFFMERGAGASNLHMRFNLASVRPGHVHLSKELEGVDDSESVLAEFPYQIYYKTSEDGEEQLLTQDPNDNLNIKVCYKDTETKVSFKNSISIGGITYPNVFLLKPGKVADIAIPDDAISYRIVECGVNTDIYQTVSVKEAECNPVAKTGNRSDYEIAYEETRKRPRVTYVNSVKPEALRNLTVTKKLYDETGENEITAAADPTTFTFRLYLGTEFDDEPVLANMHSYYVKDPAGYYCRWDSVQKKFVATDIRDLNSIQDKESIIFHTSMNGSISKIPSGYTVEVRDVLAGTQYRVEERPEEIPDGYSFQRYENAENQTITPVLRNNVSGVNDTIVFNADPSVIIRNLKGWGLRVNKTWSDEEYMSEREATYFAVFIREHGGNGNGDGDGNIQLVEGTVRQLPYGTKPQTLYWYFDKLENGKGIGDYLIREVRLNGTNGTDWQVEEDGIVTGISPHDVHSIHNNGNITLKGKQKGETSSSEFHYTVTYTQGTVDTGSNVRVDTVANNRPGIDLKKVQWDGTTPLAGAAFELRDNENNLIGTFTSDETGLITTAFLREDIDYTLTETKAPQGWYGLQAPLTITLSNNIISVSGVDESYFHVENNTNPQSVTVRDRPYTFQAIKKDGDTDTPMKGVVFALHKQKKVGDTTTIDLNPMPGYEELVTDENGVIPKLDNTLPAGTYELREKQTIEGYEMLDNYIRFTVSSVGAITLDVQTEDVALTDATNADGTIEYLMTVLNTRRKEVSFKKVDVARPADSQLEGAVFDLYSIKLVNGVETRQTPALYTGLTSGEDGMLSDSTGNTVFTLSAGKYHLVETAAPEGYIIRETPVEITVTGTDVTYDDGTSISAGNSGKTFDTETKIYTLKVSNSSGATLPSTGGPGTRHYILWGMMLLGIAAAGFLFKRRIS